MVGFSETFTGAPKLEELDANTTMLDLSNVTYHGFVNITAKFVGYNTLVVKLYNELNEVRAHNSSVLHFPVTRGRLDSRF